MHLSPAATEDAIRLLDGRSDHGPAKAGHYDYDGAELAETNGDILGTRGAASGSTCERGV